MSYVPYFYQVDFRSINCWTVTKNFLGQIVVKGGILTRKRQIVFGNGAEFEKRAPEIRGDLPTQGILRQGELLLHAAFQPDIKAPVLLAEDSSEDYLIIKVEVPNSADEQLRLLHRQAVVLGQARNCSWTRRICYDEALLMVTAESIVTLCSERRRHVWQTASSKKIIRVRRNGRKLALGFEVPS